MESQQSKVTFANLFARDIDKKINGVIKANDEKELVDEVDEYVLTGEIQQNLETFLEEYNDPANHTQNGAWISGFFVPVSHTCSRCSRIFWAMYRVAWSTARRNRSPLNRESIVRSFIAKANEQTNSMLAGELERALTIPATSILFNIVRSPIRAVSRRCCTRSSASSMRPVILRQNAVRCEIRKGSGQQWPVRGVQRGICRRSGQTVVRRSF